MHHSKLYAYVSISYTSIQQLSIHTVGNNYIYATEWLCLKIRIFYVSRAQVIEKYGFYNYHAYCINFFLNIKRLLISLKI